VRGWRMAPIVARDAGHAGGPHQHRDALGVSARSAVEQRKRGRHRHTLGNEPWYERLDITGVTVLTAAQRSALLALGAVDQQVLLGEPLPASLDQWAPEIVALKPVDCSRGSPLMDYRQPAGEYSARCGTAQGFR